MAKKNNQWIWVVVIIAVLFLLPKLQTNLFSVLPPGWYERPGNPLVISETYGRNDAPAFIRKGNETIYLYFEAIQRGETEKPGLLKSTDDGMTWEWQILDDYAGTEDWNSKGDESCPAPVKIGDTIYMFYCSRADPYKGAWQTGVATSTDWIHFTDDGNGPIFWGNHACKPILKDGIWYIFWQRKTNDGNWNVLYATTTEADFPRGWFEEPIQPSAGQILFPCGKAQCRPKVIEIDGTYWMFYNGDGNIKRRSSTNLIDWSAEEEVLGLNDGTFVEADVIKTDKHGYILAGVSNKWGGGDTWKNNIGIWGDVRLICGDNDDCQDDQVCTDGTCIFLQCEQGYHPENHECVEDATTTGGGWCGIAEKIAWFNITGTKCTDGTIILVGIIILIFMAFTLLKK